MSSELARTPDQALPPATEATPMAMLARAQEKGASLEEMKQFMDLAERWEANEARKAFNAAFTAFKAENIRIIRDKENVQYSKGERKAMYTSLENMVATVTPFLSKHGLSHSWNVQMQGAGPVTVICTLTHTMGHANSVSIPGPMDESGAKNKLQQIKSTMTYLKVATFESVCGLASAFGSTDDDGNSAVEQKGLPDVEYVSWMDAIENSADLPGLEKTYKAAYKAALDAKDKAAQGKFIDAKDKRKGELQ